MAHLRREWYLAEGICAHRGCHSARLVGKQYCYRHWMFRVDCWRVVSVALFYAALACAVYLALEWLL